MTEFSFAIGTQIQCRDKRCGKLVKVVVDPDTQSMTELIVETGILFKHERVLPLSTVERATVKEIDLDLDSDALADYMEYRETVIKEPAPGARYAERHATGLAPGFNASYGAKSPMVQKRLHEGVSAGKVVIGRETEVETLAKVLGHVDQVLVDGETGEIRHLVVRAGLFMAERRLLSVESIEEIDEDGILVSMTDADWELLPPYRPQDDEALLAAFQDRLLTSSEFVHVDVTVNQGTLRLSGRVPNKAAKRHAAGLARSLDGVVEVENALVVDDSSPAEVAPAAVQTDLGTRVSAALASHPETKDALIEVICDRGVVTLQGQVDRSRAREQAAESVAKQPGVLSVVNELVVRR